MPLRLGEQPLGQLRGAGQRPGEPLDQDDVDADSHDHPTTLTGGRLSVRSVVDKACGQPAGTAVTRIPQGSRHATVAT
ncbi:hypothetical protein Prubr_15410 [Polymorphospora rubra]|uniref:Uncharacterized protein n=1 Tax=Polymorphospora rubra TaxID=338584 RepID=A0A810MVE7_9ACTN|nr:hypothetical protein Prubr_15410 [Polymorphospora rubra]